MRSQNAGSLTYPVRLPRPARSGRIGRSFRLHGSNYARDDRPNPLAEAAFGRARRGPSGSNSKQMGAFRWTFN